MHINIVCIDILHPYIRTAVTSSEGKQIECSKQHSKQCRLSYRKKSLLQKIAEVSVKPKNSQQNKSGKTNLNSIIGYNFKIN